MEINVNDFSTDNIDPTGTSFRGYLKVSYADLVKKLGEPTDDFDDCKSDAAWNIQWNDGMVATIYNWKNGKNYLVTGIILACEGDISVAPNLRIMNYENTDKDTETEYKVNFQFKF